MGKASFLHEESQLGTWQNMMSVPSSSLPIIYGSSNQALGSIFRRLELSQTAKLVAELLLAVASTDKCCNAWPCTEIHIWDKSQRRRGIMHSACSSNRLNSNCDSCRVTGCFIFQNFTVLRCRLLWRQHKVKFLKTETSPMEKNRKPWIRWISREWIYSGQMIESLLLEDLNLDPSTCWHGTIPKVSTKCIKNLPV